MEGDVSIRGKVSIKKDSGRRIKQQMFNFFNTDKNACTKGCKIFQKLAKFKNIELKVNTTKPEQFIIRFCEELKINKQTNV